MIGPEFVRADEVVVTMSDGQPGATLTEAPLLFDVQGERVIVLWDARSMGGPVIAFGLASGTAYAIAMAVLRMRRRILKAAKETTAELRPSRTEAPFPP